MNFRKLLLGTVVVGGLAGAGYVYYVTTCCAPPAAGLVNPRGAAPIPVSVAAVEQKDVPFALSTVGNVVTEQSVAVRARIDSQLNEVLFRDGDAVNAGDLLFVLDDRAITAQLQQEQANLARDKAQMANFKRQYDRKKNLAEKGYETTSNLEEARAQYDVQRATIAATEAAIQNLKIQLEYTKIHAPISGRTGTINATLGNNVRAGDSAPMVTINQVKPIRVQMAVPQKYLDQLRQALAAGTVLVAAHPEGAAAEASGKLDYVDNIIDQATGTFSARASFPNDDETLWPGMFVTVTLTIGTQKGVLTLPEIAVQRGQDGDYVFVVAEGKVQKRPVQVERLQDGIAAISEGVTAGEQVVTDGMMKLEEGSAVLAASPSLPLEGGRKEAGR